MECQNAFDNLKELCSTTPILAYADFTKPFKLHTNASALGWSAVLYWVHEGMENMNSHASRSLTKSKTKYPVYKLEFLCLKWAITEQFHKYLYGNTFNVYTDNNLPTYVLMTAKLDAMGHKWVASLANYNFHLHYGSGKSNVEADALSQIDWGKNYKTLLTDSIQAIMTATLTRQRNDYIETIPCSPQAIESFALSIHDNVQVACKSMTPSKIESDSDSYCCPDPSWNPNCMTISDWVKVQAEDEVIHDLIQLYRTKELIRGQDTDSQEMRHSFSKEVTYL